MTAHPQFSTKTGKDLQDWLKNFPAKIDISKSIVIATNERTGSEWLCQLMGSTEMLGRPTEYLNGDWMGGFFPGYPKRDISQQVQIAHQVGTTPNGVFSMKMHSSYYNKLTAEVPFEEVFPNPVFLFLRRKDKLAQAISLVRARQTSSWHSISEEKREPFYDTGMIRSALSEVQSNDFRWMRFFVRNDINPLPIDYEDLKENPEQVLKEICMFIGLDYASIHRSDMKWLSVQSDEKNNQWKQRYLEESYNLNFLDYVGGTDEEMHFLRSELDRFEKLKVEWYEPQIKQLEKQIKYKDAKIEELVETIHQFEETRTNWFEPKIKQLEKIIDDLDTAKREWFLPRIAYLEGELEKVQSKSSKE